MLFPRFHDRWDGRIADPSFAAREEGSPCWCRVSAYYRDYARTNNFVQTRHPLAKPLNAAAKYVTRLKIRGRAL